MFDKFNMDFDKVENINITDLLDLDFNDKIKDEKNKDKIKNTENYIINQ